MVRLFTPVPPAKVTLNGLRRELNQVENAQSIYSETHGCANQGSAQRSRHDRTSKRATPFCGRKFYMNDDEQVASEEHEGVGVNA